MHLHSWRYYYPNSFIGRLYLGRKQNHRGSVFPNEWQIRSAEEEDKLHGIPNHGSGGDFFNANNWQITAEAAEELRLPVLRIATDMGRLMGLLHYTTGYDGRGIEFVIGGHEDDPFTRYKFFCIDFDQMRPHNNVKDVLVRSFFQDDPYFPTPGMKYWDAFKSGYLLEASDAQTNDAGRTLDLALQVLDEVCKTNEVSYGTI